MSKELYLYRVFRISLIFEKQVYLNQNIVNHEKAFKRIKATF